MTEGEQEELNRLRAVVASVRTYAEDAQHIAVIMKGDSLLKGNMTAYTSSQGAIDVLLDMLSVLDGKKIPTLEEVKKDMEKAQAENNTTDTTPYVY